MRLLVKAAVIGVRLAHEALTLLGGRALEPGSDRASALLASANRRANNERSVGVSRVFMMGFSRCVAP